MTDMAASCIFPHDEQDTSFFLGMLNTKLYQWVLNLYNPTVNYQPVDVQRLPVPDLTQADKASIGVLAATAAQAVGALREMEITDRNYHFNPATYLPLGRRLPLLVEGIWLKALRYVLAMSSIDLKLAEILHLPAQERLSMTTELGADPCDYPLIKGYEALPVAIDKELFIAPDSCLTCSPSELAAIKHKLRQLYTDDSTKTGSLTPEAFFVSLAAELKIHPLTVFHLISEGASREGWRCNFLEKRLTEDFFSALVLVILGHRWPNNSANINATYSAGVVPLFDVNSAESMPVLIRKAVAVYCAPRIVEKDFAQIVGDNLEKWVVNKFFKRHISQFKKRPVAWQIASRQGRGSAFSCLVYFTQALHMPKIAGDLTTQLLLLLNEQPRCTETEAKSAELQNFASRLMFLNEYMPRIEYGVRVNIAPLQKAGLLAAPVLSPDDAARAVAAFRDWQETFI